MSNGWKVRSLLMLLAVVGAAVLIMADLAEAQATAVVTGLRGQVRVMPKGATAFRPLQIGMRVGEGADIVAAAGGSVELRLPDGSSLMVAENSRFVVTRLDYDQQNRMRSSYFHLAVGRLRGIVSKAAATLVASRQANFVISTPTAVAAVRGSTVYANHVDGVTTFLVTEGIANIILPGQPPIRIEVRPGDPPLVLRMGPGITPVVQPATPAQVTTLTTAANPATPGTTTVLGATSVVVTDPGTITGIIGGPITEPTLTTATGAATESTASGTGGNPPLSP